MELRKIVMITIYVLLVMTLINLESTGLVSFDRFTLEGYPYYFFDGHVFNANIIKGDVRDSGEISAANLIINSIPEQYRSLQRTKYGGGYYQVRVFPEELQGKVFVYNKDKFNPRMKNGIVIGTPCHNDFVAHLLGIKDCRRYFSPGQGLVKVVEAYGQVYIVITGYGAEEVWATANAFVDGINRGILTGTEFRTRLQEYVQVPNLQIGEPIGKRLPAVY